ncbi:MAG TPA: hypothetical protein VH597_05595 [Verrucomicrobiae bacterium]|jgi:hypothetical protein|nr:hypothetical protein [Verrucomicrobiae bacterium]
MPDPQQRRKRGCLFYAGIIGAVLLVVLLLGAFFGIRYAKGLVSQLTDVQPMPLPTVQLPEVQLFQLHDRVDTFRDSVRNGESVAPLELSADELNALIETDPAMAALKNHLFVSITNSQLYAQVSFPAEDLGMVRLRGRYINANGMFNVGLTNGELQITAVYLSAKGQPLPRNIMREIARENLADKFNSDPRAAAGLKRLQAVQVKDGKLIIVPQK